MALIEMACGQQMSPTIRCTGASHRCIRSIGLILLFHPHALQQLHIINE